MVWCGDEAYTSIAIINSFDSSLYWSLHISKYQENA